MRFLFIILLFSVSSFAKTSEDVVGEYVGFIENPKIEKIEEIFSDKFIKELGGKEKIIELYKSFEKKKRDYKIHKMSSLDNIDYVQISSGKHKSTFILKKQGSDYKIDGTINAE